MTTPLAATKSLYLEPVYVAALDDCLFYHTMDLPELGTVSGCWDLRETVDAYLGNFDFTGKRVLDVGAASGFLSFEMEKRGAEVTSFDLKSGDDWDLVPYVHPECDLESLRAGFRADAERIKNSYWLAHRLLDSAARVHAGHIYDLPAALGPVDVAMFGMILGHLRDPFLALASVSRLVEETIIITNQSFRADEPCAYFMPKARTCFPRAAWWALSEPCLGSMLEVVGFEVQSVERSDHQCKRAPAGLPSGREAEWQPELERCSTITARRVRSASRT